MNENKFFGESQGFNPQEDTLKEVVDKMEEMDKKNQERGGEGTVVLENTADEKGKIRLSTEEVPDLRKDNTEQKDNE